MNKDEKLRRMELRKEVGCRTIEPPKPPPYHRGPEYLVAHACFSCSKSFKLHGEGKDKVCPECEGPIYEMGRSFKPPKKNDKKQWEKVKLLYSAGFRFVGCGSHEGPKLPDKLSETKSFIENNPNHPLRFEVPKEIK